MAMTEVILTVPEVAERLRVQDETVRRWLRSGRLRGVLLSRRAGYRVPASEVRRLLGLELGWERSQSGPTQPHDLRVENGTITEIDGTGDGR